MSSQPLATGALTPASTWGDFNQIAFVIQQLLSKVQTATLVKIIACTNNGDTSPVGFVDVLPLVNQVDAAGNPQPHVTIYGLPYLRLQGGANAVIIDPQPGDIGIAIFASRDISRVKSTKAQANPGSFRSHDFSDGMYLGGMLNGVPTQFVQFNASGIMIQSNIAIVLKAPTITLDGAVSQVDGSVTIAGSLDVTGDITAEGTSVHTHVHTSNTPGNPTSPPL